MCFLISGTIPETEDYRAVGASNSQLRARKKVVYTPLYLEAPGCRIKLFKPTAMLSQYGNKLDPANTSDE
jgi:hypothetical protein